MRIAAMMRGALSALAVSTAGCSLINLSGDIEQAQCASHEDCDVLNDRSAPDFDPCRIWQCAESLYCERYPLDLDYDGFSPRSVMHDGEELVCEEEASQSDCDDDSAISSPDTDERCDALDNDCDSQIDEGELDRTSAITNVFANENANGTGEVSYAVDPDSGTVAAAYGIVRGASSVPGFSTIESGLGSGSAIQPLSLPAGTSGALLADSAGVGALGGERFAVAFVNDSGGRHLVAGVVDADGSGFELDVAGDVLRRGLRCAAGETCSDNHSTTAGEPIVAVPLTVTPAVVANGDDVLVAYARAAEGEGACAAPGEDVETAPVLANGLRYDDMESRLSELAGAALELGTTSDRSTPAVLAVPDFEGERELGFLVAFSNAEGGVELVHVAVESGALVLRGTLLTFGDAEQRFSDMALVRGGGDGSAHTLGLVLQAGCGAGARVAFSMLRLQLEDGALRVTREGGLLAIGNSRNQTRPSVAWSEERSAWLVAYRDGSGLRARALTAEGELLGMDSYTLLAESDSGADSLRLAASPFVVPLANEAWFGAIAATERAEDYVLQTVKLSSCE